MVTLGRTVSLRRKTNAVSFAMQPAAGAAAGELEGTPGVEALVLYLILLFLYPNVMFVLTGLFIMILASAF
tara:strand:+ start:9 stop:221 length:213 start_codon:yes stop_codon:yes gene_type:complete